MQILYDVASADRQLTVDDLPYGQFMVYDNKTEMLYPMTEENCNTENWDADPDVYQPTSFFDRFIVSVKAFVNWLKLFFDYIATTN